MNNNDLPDVGNTETATQKAAASVANRSSYLKHPALKWGIGCLSVIIVIAFFSGKPKPSTKMDVVTAPNAPVTHDESDSILAANLAQLAKQDEVSQTSNTDTPELTSSGEDNQAALARQNAPTSMFSSGDSSVASSTAQSDKPTDAIFAGKGGASDFGNQSLDTTSVQATKIAHPSTTIASGEFIQAVLETAISSDLPGMVRAIVSRPVYAYVGEEAIIPAGSRLIGQYDSGILQGQSRVMVMWNRVILPDGITVQLNSPGNDDLGRAGQGADDINTHFWARFGQATLLSIMGAGTATAGVDPTDGYNSASAYRMAIAQSFQQTASQNVQQQQNIQPTLTLHQGAAINVFVAHDLDFYNALKQTSNDG